MKLDEAEGGGMAGWVEGKGCLAEPGKATDIGYQSGPGCEEQSKCGLKGLRRVRLSWAMGEWKRGMRILLICVNLDYRRKL